MLDNQVADTFKHKYLIFKYIVLLKCFVVINGYESQKINNNTFLGTTK